MNNFTENILLPISCNEMLIYLKVKNDFHFDAISSMENIFCKQLKSFVFVEVEKYFNSNASY